MEPFELIYKDKYFHSYLRNGLIVDSCILLDFLHKFLLQNKNLQINKNQEKIERFLSINCKKYVTPHILTELSNLINTNNRSNFKEMIELLKRELEEYEEIPISKKDILNELSVNQFGITDTGMKILPKKDNKIVFTKDEPFCNHCKYKEKLPAIHLKDLESLFLTLELFK